MRPRAESRRMWETEEREGDEKKREMREDDKEEEEEIEVVRRASRKPREVGGRMREGSSVEARLQERQVDEYLLQRGCQTKMEIESSMKQLRSK